MNGVLVAVSANDLSTQTEEQIQETGKKVRARIDEMQDAADDAARLRDLHEDGSRGRASWSSSAT
jgi:hypothetical protein